MKQPRTAILHYAAPPEVGGVEAVIRAHTQAFLLADYPVTVIAGRGDVDGLPVGAQFVRIPRVDSRHPEITAASQHLREGRVPASFKDLSSQLSETLRGKLAGFDNLIVHNVFTKRFNLPLTAALFSLLDQGLSPNCIAWCHDIGWTSDHSRSELHPGYPWDLLRTQRDDVTYVAVSERRREALAQLFDCPLSDVHVVHNGVDPAVLLGLSNEGTRLVERLRLWESDLILLMPVRITRAKNVELALRVLASLRAGGRRARLILTGPPDPHDQDGIAYLQCLRALRHELDLEDEATFVFEAGSDLEKGLTIGMPVVADLLRVADVIFIPSHREGFGMPVLEAGLVGIPVVCTDVPAAREIGGEDVTLISPDGDPDETADRVLSLVEGGPVHRLRRRVRQGYTWQAIFRSQIEPLLRGKERT